MKLKRFLSMFALLLMAATGAWAQEETLLTTITPTSKDSYSETTAGVVTVTHDNSDIYGEYGWVWWANPGSITVEAKEGYTITRCVFRQSSKTPVTVSSAPFKVSFIETANPSHPDQKKFMCQGDWKLNMNGVSSIEVYGYANAPAPATYSVTLAEGTEDADNWTISPTEAAEGATVTATYSGEKKVKSVKAVKKKVGPEVSTFSELQAVLSAGKDVKLMKDIVCTAEIEINSDGALTIDGNGKTLSTTSAIRAFKVESSATVAFKNLTLTGFVNGGGPAINNDGTIVLDGCTISNCHVNNSNGGGAIESTGKLYAVNTTFSGNYSGEIGGAINNYWGSLYMTDCTFTDNYTTDSHAYYGGAIGINGGDEVRLINCAFSGNKYGTNAGTNDIGVYNKPEKYTIAGCTGATIAARADVGDITTIAKGTATLDYSDLSNISFTYSAPVTVTWNGLNFNSNPYTRDGVTLTISNNSATGNNFYSGGDKTFTTTLGKFTKIEIVCEGNDFNGWAKESAGGYQIPEGPYVEVFKLTWTGNAESVTIPGGNYLYGIQSITFNIQ